MFWKFNLLTSSHVDTLLEKEVITINILNESMRRATVKFLKIHEKYFTFPDVDDLVFEAEEHELKQLLEPDVTLRELMDEDDILQECKAQNRKLIDFLTQPENMEDMVKMITKEPEEDVEEKLRFKHPNTACELLTSDVSQINDKLASDRELVDQLYSFLECDRPLNPLLASFFSKVMGLLITRKSEMIFEYLKSQKDFVGSLLHHIGTSAIMDLLLRLITCIESPETRRSVIEWLNENQIVQRLVDCIVPSNDEDIQCNAAQSLCDIVRLGREQMMQLQDTSDPDPLLTTMELEETVCKMLNNMFELEQNESVIVNGLFVIHTLLEVRRQGQDGLNDQMAAIDTDRLSQGMNNVMAAIIPRLKNFHSLLITPPKQKYSIMPTSIGSLDPPLGNARLQVAKLITALVTSNVASVNIELVNLNTLQALLDLYFRYSWNNFLHTQVEQCVVSVLNNPAAPLDGTTEQPLLQQLFTDVRLPQRLLDEWEENDQQQGQDGGRRKGFMGHLTKIANALTASTERGCNCDMIKELWTEVQEDCKQKWDAFVQGSLSEVNKKNTVEFRGHPLASSSEDDDADFKDIPFPQDTAMQQAFSDYQLQQMTSNFIDQFGFNEEEFAEQEEKIDAPFSDRISSINFNIQANEVSQPNNTMFDQACNDRIQQFDDDDSDEDIWVEKPLTFDKNAQHMRSGRLQAQTARANSSDDSTDSEEELDSPHSIPQQAPPLASSHSASPTSTASPVSCTTAVSTSTPAVTVPTVMAAAEKMDVDFSEGTWTSNGEGAGQAEPAAMETSSPWEAEAAPPPAPREGWASFEKNQASTEENWADFSSFSDMSNAGNGPRSSSPVAMDISEGSRSNVYMVGEDSNAVPDSSSGDDLATPRKDQPGVGSSDIKVESIDFESEAHLSPDTTATLPATSSTSQVTSSAISTTTTTKDDTPATDVTVSSALSEAESEKPSSAEAAMEGKGSAVVAAGAEAPMANAMAVDSSVDCCSTAAGGNSIQEAELSNEATPSEPEADEDLSANFDFLTGCGLIGKKSGAKEEGDTTSTGAGDQSSAEADADDQPTTTTSDTMDVEAARAQAKEAMERFDTASSMMAAETTVRNGPV